MIDTAQHSISGECSIKERTLRIICDSNYNTCIMAIIIIIIITIIIITVIKFMLLSS